jgi:CysZ protein
MITELITGARMLARGFGFWARRPGVMFLGLVPAMLVFIGMVVALVVLGVNLPALVDWATPFADGWHVFWAGTVRILIGTLALAGAVVLAATTFTAITLTVGDPFYERIWRAVELHLGGEIPDRGAGFWRAAADGLALIALGVVTAIVVALVGVIPLIGSVAAPILGVVLSGRLLARELTLRAFEARGLAADVRRAVLRTKRTQMLGFGIATQLCFLVPLGAVVTMPAAVAGSTMLARAALDAHEARRAP